MQEMILSIDAIPGFISTALNDCNKNILTEGMVKEEPV